jgi:hypothetical protein
MTTAAIRRTGRVGSEIVRGVLAHGDAVAASRPRSFVRAWTRNTHGR